jgi:hypothetical protein
VVDAEKGMEMPRLAAEEDRKKAFEETKLAVAKGAQTRIPQLVPPGTSQAAVGIMEVLIVDLPSKDYFLKTLYRQRYAGEDENGMPPWAPEAAKRLREDIAARKKAQSNPQQEARETGTSSRTP